MVHATDGDTYMSDGSWQPTTRLRFVMYTSPLGTTPPQKILQQWWAPDMPGYMRDPLVGEWRDVPVSDDPGPLGVRPHDQG